eukprot:Partr_v1_DN28982_c1_g1_i1_m25885
MKSSSDKELRYLSSRAIKSKVLETDVKSISAEAVQCFNGIADEQLEKILENTLVNEKAISSLTCEDFSMGCRNLFPRDLHEPAIKRGEEILVSEMNAIASGSTVWDTIISADMKEFTASPESPTKEDLVAPVRNPLIPYYRTAERLNYHYSNLSRKFHRKDSTSATASSNHSMDSVNTEASSRTNPRLGEAFAPEVLVFVTGMCEHLNWYYLNVILDYAIAKNRNIVKMEDMLHAISRNDWTSEYFSKSSFRVKLDQIILKRTSRSAAPLASIQANASNGDSTQKLENLLDNFLADETLPSLKPMAVTEAEESTEDLQLPTAADETSKFSQTKPKIKAFLGSLLPSQKNLDSITVTHKTLESPAGKSVGTSPLPPRVKLVAKVEEKAIILDDDEKEQRRKDREEMLAFFSESSPDNPIPKKKSVKQASAVLSSSTHSTADLSETGSRKEEKSADIHSLRSNGSTDKLKASAEALAKGSTDKLKSSHGTIPQASSMAEQDSDEDYDEKGRPIRKKKQESLAEFLANSGPEERPITPLSEPGTPSSKRKALSSRFKIPHKSNDSPRPITKRNMDINEEMQSKTSLESRPTHNNSKESLASSITSNVNSIRKEPYDEKAVAGPIEKTGEAVKVPARAQVSPVDDDDDDVNFGGKPKKKQESFADFLRNSSPEDVGLAPSKVIDPKPKRNLSILDKFGKKKQHPVSAPTEAVKPAVIMIGSLYKPENSALIPPKSSITGASSDNLSSTNVTVHDTDGKTVAEKSHGSIATSNYGLPNERDEIDAFKRENFNLAQKINELQYQNEQLSEALLKTITSGRPETSSEAASKIQITELSSKNAALEIELEAIKAQSLQEKMKNSITGLASGNSRAQSQTEKEWENLSVELLQILESLIIEPKSIEQLPVKFALYRETLMALSRKHSMAHSNLESALDGATLKPKIAAIDSTSTGLVSENS